MEGEMAEGGMISPGAGWIRVNRMMEGEEVG